MPEAKTNSAADPLLDAPAGNKLEEVVRELKILTLEQIEKYQNEDEIEIEIMPEGGAVLNWWTPVGARVACELCGKKGTRECIMCINTTPWCG